LQIKKKLPHTAFFFTNFFLGLLLEIKRSNPRFNILKNILFCF